MRETTLHRVSAISAIFLPGVLALGATAANAQAPGTAADPTGRAIMEAYRAQDRTADTQVEVAMTMVNAGGSGRHRSVTLLTHTDADGRRMQLIRFTAPADIAGTGFLSIEEPGEDDAWLYLPALRRVRRIAGGDRQDSFVGTDFAYEDLDPEQLDGNTYERAATDTVDGRPAWVVDAVPTEDRIERTGYGHRELWIDQERHVLLRARLYDHEGSYVKQLTASDVRQVPGTGKWRPYRLTMETIQDATRTVLEFSGYRIDQGVPASRFTQRYLRRGG